MKIGVVLGLALMFAVEANAQLVRENVPELEKIKVTEHLGNKIPLDLTFTDETGKSVKLAEYFGKGKPVILTLAYYECPMLCSLILNGLTNGVRKLALVPSEDFQMVTISIDPKETYTLAAAKKSRYVDALNRQGAAEGWAFLTGAESQSKALADAVGFGYYYDKDRKEYAHPAVSYVLTSDGKISRYLYGIEFKEKDLRLALLEAADGKIGTTMDKVLLYCYHYDSKARGYVVFAGNVMRIGGLLTLVVLVVILTSLWTKERIRPKNS
jgi:protein SCO1/2